MMDFIAATPVAAPNQSLDSDSRNTAPCPAAALSPLTLVIPHPLRRRLEYRDVTVGEVEGEGVLVAEVGRGPGGRMVEQPLGVIRDVMAASSSFPDTGAWSVTNLSGSRPAWSVTNLPDGLVACAVDKLPDGPMACAVDKSSCPDRTWSVTNLPGFCLCSPTSRCCAA